MVDNEEILMFLKAAFPPSTEEIRVDEFLTKCLVYYFPEEEFSRQILQNLYVQIEE